MPKRQIFYLVVDHRPNGKIAEPDLRQHKQPHHDVECPLKRQKHSVVVDSQEEDEGKWEQKR